MASFTVSAVTNNSVTITISQSAGSTPWYTHFRVFVRKSTETAGVYDSWSTGGQSTSFTVTVSGLVAGTDYVVNVAPNTSTEWTESTSWLGAQTFKTSGTAPKPPAAGGYIYINQRPAEVFVRNNGVWVNATTFIRSSGSWFEMK